MKKDKTEFVINDKVFKPFISEKEIKSIIKKLAKMISDDYFDKKPVFLVVLKGSVFFAADLLREIEIECEFETIRAISYGSSMASSGKVDLSGGRLDIKGKHVIVLEDIVDTGNTLKSLLDKLKLLNPESLESVSLLSKPVMRKVDVEVKYTGREIPPVFVIGYGLDYDEQGRNLSSIYSLAK